ncbi:amidohydrolase family protein [Nonomuraea phyllanthi]|uniref:N-acyl-D-amino-acid deacylase family protein n=1 Tax=Nonomuraea phyllanthi TaxID=2219224 RepID=UPI00129370AC|nr:amidohydrolase family protein [Nonomuraea phyllanthi]QFY06517.1 amidohydrolase family protein [Nonomuraea phyllanthi]
MRFDVVISGGRVLDGTGAPPYRADVGIADGRIAQVGRLAGATAETVVDATGRFVAPGFVDCHAHGDAAVFDPAVQRAALRQGVTTFVLGQDGLSFAPGSAATVAYVSRYFAAVNGPRPGGGAAVGDVPDGPLSVGELLDGYDRAVALNTAYLLPHGTIRYDVMGPSSGAPSRDDLAAMVGRVERGLSEGAVGLSSGLEYLPGRYATAGELAALCAPLGGLPYVTHMRAYGARAEVGMSEVMDIAGRSGAAVHVSHLHGPADVLLPLVERALGSDVDLTFDTYPYLRGNTILAMVVLPDSVPGAETDRALEMIASGELDDWWPTLDATWPRLTVSHAPGLEWAEGLTMVAAAERAGVKPAEFCRRLLTETRLEAGVVSARPDEGPEGEQSVRRMLRHPSHTGGSDGIYVGGHPHPRGFGAFARFLGRHVRELGDWTWEQAVVHLASHPARRFGLTDRGLVRGGFAADVVVIDPAEVGDRATYEAPRTPAAGIGDVFVSGVRVLAGGELTGATPGRALRS